MRGDRYGTPAQVEAIVRLSGGPAEPLIVPDCGHAPRHERRAPVLDAMAEFIARVTP